MNNDLDKFLKITDVTDATMYLRIRDIAAIDIRKKTNSEVYTINAQSRDRVRTADINATEAAKVFAFLDAYEY